MARQRLAYLQRLRQAHGHCAGKRMSNRNVASMYRQGLELRDDYQHFLFQHGILSSFEGSRDSFRWARVLFESRGGAGSSEKVSVRIVHPARSFGDHSESRAHGETLAAARCPGLPLRALHVYGAPGPAALSARSVTPDDS